MSAPTPPETGERKFSIALQYLPIMVSAASLVVALLAYSVNSTNIHRLDERFNKLGNLYLEAEVKDGRFSIVPTDNDKHILNLQIQYPANTYKYAIAGISGTAGGSEIDLDNEAQKYLVNRYSIFWKKKLPLPLGKPKVGLLPIVIYTTYVYAGEQRADRSAYMLSYGIVSVTPTITLATAAGLAFCGRLADKDPSIDYLGDPWMPSTVGDAKQTTTTMYISCSPPTASPKIPSDKTRFFWIHVPPGKAVIESDISAPLKGHTHTWTFDIRGLVVRPITPKPMNVSYNFSYAEN